jgi:aspartate/methionine/tyrosine aminotransferase
MEFEPFAMERWMSKFEQEVEYNLSESGVHPMTLGELLDLGGVSLEELRPIKMNYPHVNGLPKLRDNIARLYSGAAPENVLVTTGAIEANYNIVHTLLSPGDEFVVMLPNYMQVWGAAKNLGCTVKEFHLREDLDWGPDLDELESAVTGNTKLVAVCNPNNPTGRILTEGEMDRIVAVAERVGAWILVDEVYKGTDRLSDEENPSSYGRYDRVIVVNSTSKAYGLPGLRIGWLVAPEELVDEVWARHEYTTICATMLANELAALALSPEVRPSILARTRKYIREGYAVLEQWMNSHADTLTVRPPDAAAIAFVRYHLDINSSEFVDRLRAEKSVLIVPGDHFGVDRFVRVSFGLPEDYLVPALDRIHDLITEVQARE